MYQITWIGKLAETGIYIGEMALVWRNTVKRLGRIASEFPAKRMAIITSQSSLLVLFSALMPIVRQLSTLTEIRPTIDCQTCGW